MSLEQREWFKDWKRGYQEAFDEKLTKKQDEINALRKQLEEAYQQQAIIRKQLEIAVEAIKTLDWLICEADPNAYRQREVVRNFFAEIEKVKDERK